MGISCANRIVGKTNKEIQCKHKELNSTLPAYAITFIGGERGTTHLCGEQDRSLIQVTQLSVTWTLKHSHLNLPVHMWQWAAGTVSSAGCHHAREIEAKHAEVQMALRLQCKCLPWLIVFILKKDALRHFCIPVLWKAGVHFGPIYGINTLTELASVNLLLATTAMVR